MPEYRLIEKIVPTDREAVGNHPTHTVSVVIVSLTL